MGARPAAAELTTNLLQQLKLKVFEYPPYKLGPRDYHLFCKLKDFLGGDQYGNNNELKKGVNEWFNNLAVIVYVKDIEMLVKRYDKCLNLNGDYVKTNS